MKKFLASALVSMILLVIGLCLLIKPDPFMNLICYIAGGVSIVIAAIKFWSAYKKNTIAKEVLTCIVLLVLGVILIALQSSIIRVFPVVVGICFLVYGLLKLKTAFSLKKQREDIFRKLLISSLIGIALAILIIVLAQFIGEWIYRIIGLLLIYNAAENIFSYIIARPASEKAEKKAKKNAVEAEVEESREKTEE